MVTMKTFIATIVVFLACATAWAQDMAAAKLCIKKFDANHQDIQDFRFGLVNANDIPESLQCAIKCILEHEGWVDATTGEFRPETLKANLTGVVTPDVFDSLMQYCEHFRMAQTCKEAARLMQCLWGRL